MMMKQFKPYDVMSTSISLVYFCIFSESKVIQMQIQFSGQVGYPDNDMG